MDQGSWLWKKKPVEKTIVAYDKTASSPKGNQEQRLQYEKEADLERSVKDLNERLASLIRECNAKDELLAIRSKASQEAIAGRKKAEAEVIHLNAALKDSKQQLSSAKEEHDQKVREVIVKTSKDLEKDHKKVEEKLQEKSRWMANLAFENSQLTNALLVKEKMIESASEQMSQATGEFKILMDRLDSTEKENTFLKYEFQMLEKELETQNNETEFIRRSAEASEKKNLQSVKKISKLEAECQRLRVLVRKRLPGPVALAKMKSEVEMQGRNDQIGFMAERLYDLEEENKILKEIVLTKEDELRSLRTTFSLLASKLSQVEDERGDLSKTQNSVELIDDSKSWASALLCQLENFKQVEIDNLSEHKMLGDSEMSLMDDFAEMEKLAIVCVDSQSVNSSDIVGKEIIPVTQFDSANTESGIERLQYELESVLESKRLVEDQIDNQKLINEELNTQLSVTRSQLNKLLQKVSFLEEELEDRSRCCEELEAKCLELQIQQESVSCKELPKDNEKKEEKSVQTGLETAAASKKLAECQENILNLGKQLRALSSAAESTAFDKKTNEKTLSQQRSSLRDHMLDEDDVETEDPNSPKTKEIIISTEKMVASNLQSSSDRGFYEVKSTVTGAMAIVPRKNQSTVTGAMAIVPRKNRGGGSNLLAKLLFRRKKGGSAKKLLLTA